MANEFTARNGIIAKNNSIISGSLSTGFRTQAIGNYSHAEGSNTTAGGSESHAEGSSTTTSADFSHAEGGGTTTNGIASHAEGGSTQAVGNYSHAEGSGTVANGVASHTEGDSTNTTSDAAYSHAEGRFTTANGAASHAEGSETTAYGYSSHAEGLNTIASGSYSHAEGYGTITDAEYQHAQGSWNIVSSIPSAFILGNGDENTRSNLIFAAGNRVEITGSLSVTQDITGSLIGTASFATSASFAISSSTAVSASFALTASSTPQLYRIVNNTDSAVVSGSTALTLIYSQLIPANTFAAGDIVRISWRGQKTNFNGSNFAFIYINTTSTVSGATLLGSWSTTANPRMEQMDRKLYIKNATTNTEVYNVTANSAGEYTNTSTSAFANIAINWTINQYIIAANSLGSALDTFKGSSYEIERIRTT